MEYTGRAYAVAWLLIGVPLLALASALVFLAGALEPPVGPLLPSALRAVSPAVVGVALLIAALLPVGLFLRAGRVRCTCPLCAHHWSVAREQRRRRMPLRRREAPRPFDV